ncbi:hypothetical protein CC2G_012203 [Coprinopsis cinerea AmutBmut pab1-1]|nr:hypothetical protein CC2G_012203 [Coprinopsis cinerea AmutBmut pab1-1]
MDSMGLSRLERLLRALVQAVRERHEEVSSKFRDSRGLDQRYLLYSLCTNGKEYSMIGVEIDPPPVDVY